MNRNPNGGCNYNHHHVIRHAELDLEHMYKKSTVNRISYILIFVVYLKLVVVVVIMLGSSHRSSVLSAGKEPQELHEFKSFNLTR